MQCPFCNVDNDKVIDSRSTEAGKSIRRRRQCLACKKRFTTYEHIEENTKLTVIKKDGSRVPFDRAKIQQGIEKACYKRPVSAMQISKIVDEIEEEIFRLHDREVGAMEIGNITAERLKTVDQVAYVRFASVYKSFKNLEDLMSEMRDVFEAGQPEPPGQGRLFT